MCGVNLFGYLGCMQVGGGLRCRPKTSWQMGGGDNFHPNGSVRRSQTPWGDCTRKVPQASGGNCNEVKQLRRSKVQAYLGISLPDGTDPQRTNFRLSDHMLGSCIFGWGCGSFLLPALQFTISEHFSADLGITKTGALGLRPNPGIPAEMGTIASAGSGQTSWHLQQAPIWVVGFAQTP